MYRPLPLLLVGLCLQGQGPFHSLESLPQLAGARRNTAEEALRAQSQRPPYCEGPAQGSLGEALGGVNLRKRRFQILSSTTTPPQVVAFYQKALGAKPGVPPEEAPAGMKAGSTTPVLYKRYSSGGGFVSHHFRWVSCRENGDLASFEIVVEQPRPAGPETLVLLTEAVFAADRPVKAPRLSTRIHPSLRYDLNGSSRLPGQVMHRFLAELALPELSAWYEKLLQRQPSRNDDRCTFLLGDQPGDLSRMLVLRSLGEGRCEATFVVPDEM